jgi:hypothetical protein
MCKHRITVWGIIRVSIPTKKSQFLSSDFKYFKIYLQGFVTLIGKAAISQAKYKYLLIYVRTVHH